MPKQAVKVYLSKELIDLLDRACTATGEGRSGIVKTALLEYLKALNLIREAVHSGTKVPHDSQQNAT